MRLLRRKETPAPAPPPVTPPDPHRDDDFSGTVDALRAEIASLADANRVSPDRETERRLVRLRHIAGRRLVDGAPAEVSFTEPDYDRLGAHSGNGQATGPLPEIAAAELTPGLVRAGILRDGCLLVRGLCPRDTALALADAIDRGFDERERWEAGGGSAPGYYEEFQPHTRFGDVVGRKWIEQGGGLLAADAPMLHFSMMEIFDAAGLTELVSTYLGEPALISVHKTTLRKADPSVPGAWHQDGFFMGEVRSLNLWLSLSRCGDEAPGLDILPRRLDHYVATATEEAKLDYTISQLQVEKTAGETPVLRPIFEPGDALLFDELFLHQTGSDPSMPKPRYAVENWFFGGSAFPDEYAPVAV